MLQSEKCEIMHAVHCINEALSDLDIFAKGLDLPWSRFKVLQHEICDQLAAILQVIADSAIPNRPHCKE